MAKKRIGDKAERVLKLLLDVPDSSMEWPARLDRGPEGSLGSLNRPSIWWFLRPRSNERSRSLVAIG